MALLRRLSVFGALLALSLTLVGTTGCVGNGSSGPVPPPSGGASAAPTTLTYQTSPAVYTKGTAITANVPASTGGAITSYSVAPALPAGLTLSTTSGQITGTPMGVAPVATFAILGSNGLGSAVCLLSITVNDAAPAGLTYPNPVLSLRRGTAVTAQIPTTTGGVPATYTVAPALPVGLVLNAATGVITGTPSAVSPSATFTLTAGNASGSTTCQIAIAVVDVAPLNLTYPSATLTLYRAVPLAIQTPTNAGGLISSFSVAPTLPAGLTLSASTGVLSGTPTTLQGAATYVVTGTNSGGSATAQIAISVGDPAPVISTQPAAAAAAVGGSASFTVAAQGVTALSYQWQKDGTSLTSGGNIAGATSASLALSAITAGDTGAYSVVVSNAVGGVTFTTTSSTAALAVTTPPTITTQPTSLTINQGQNATFTVAASASGTLSYQWRKGSTNLANGGNISGATSGTLTLTSAALADAGSYQVVVTNTQNAVASSVTSSAATLTIIAPISITAQPQTKVVTAPDSPTFTVVATGGSNLTYQWKKNGTAISGATASSYTVPGFTDLQTVPDSYTVVLDNGASLESNSATYSVVAPNPFYLPGGEPVPVPNRLLTVLPSLHVDAVKFPNGSFRLGYDEALKNPVWTAYADFKVNTAYPNSTGDYQTDTRLVAPFVAPADMGTHGGAGFFLANGQGFDRGHMVTRSDVSYRYGQQAGDDATYMSDMIPQVSYYNQRLWNDLEEAVGGRMSGSTFTNGLTNTFGRVWIYSGPVFTGTTAYWVPSTETYTTNRAGVASGATAIAIPTATYRIMVAEPVTGQTLPRVMAWMSSNRAYATSETADLWKYVTSVKRIEDLTGLDFFPSLTHDSALSAWKSTVDVRSWGISFEKAVGPNIHIIQPSWDLIPIAGNPVLLGDSVNVGDTVSFEAAVSPNQSGGTITPATGCTWTFGDGTAATTGLTTSHSYSSAGSYTVTFSATDSLSQSNTITRVVTVVSITPNSPPVFTPSTLPAVTATLGVSIPNVTFTLTDDKTTPGSITVVATSDNQGLIPDSSLSPVNTNGTVTIALTPLSGQSGTANISVTATDGDAAATVKSFAVTINTNNPPVFTPATLADVNASMNGSKQVTFTLTDDQTDPGALSVVVTSNNQMLLPDANISVTNSSGSVTVTLIPATGQTGSALITVVATDGSASSTTKTFTLNVSSGSPALIISQYYEGASFNKWIEVTNVGSAPYEASVSPLYLGIWTNPNGSNTFKTVLIPGTIAPGASILFKNSGAVLPAAGFLTNGGTATTDNNVINFNGNDPVFITTVITATSAAWDARIDAIGDLSWGAANPAADKSFYRIPSILAGNPTWTAAEWIQKTMAEVDASAATDVWRLGYHVYNH